MDQYKFFIKLKQDNEVSNNQNILFKNIFEVLKETLKGKNFHFLIYAKKLIVLTKNNDQGKLLTYLEIDGNKLHTFYCDSEYTQDNLLEVAIRSDILYKCTKSTDAKDTLILYIKKKNSNILVIHRIDESGHPYKYKLHLYDIEYRFHLIDPDLIISNNTYITKINSSQFNKLIKEYNRVADIDNKRENVIEVVCTKKKIKFIGQMGSNNSKFEHTINIKNDSIELIQDLFLVQHLATISKANGINKEFDIYMDNGLPLLIKYNIGNKKNIIGILMFCLLPDA